MDNSRLTCGVTDTEMDRLIGLIAEVVRGYQRQGHKASDARDHAALDLGMTARAVRRWLSEDERPLITGREKAETPALIVAGHKAWLRREAARARDHAVALDARLQSERTPLRSVI